MRFTPMSNLFTKLIVEPGAKMKLGDIFPGYRRFHLHEATLPEVQPRVRRTDPMQLPDLHQEFLVEPGSQGEAGRDRSELPRKVRVG